MGAKARLEYTHGGRVARLILNTPKANIVDRAMMADLSSRLDEIAARRDLCAVVLEAEGPHFSFGASIEEHMPGVIEGTLADLGNLLRKIAATPAPTIAAVRGQCLGGGLELVLACDLVIAEKNASLGLPEIRLGVFPPAGAALLPARISAGVAAQLVLTGTSWTGARAESHGLVARLAPEGGLAAALEAWLAEEFAGRSPDGLRHAVAAARRPLHRALAEDLPAMEKRYINELMKEPDAMEGIHAFLEKRDPCWSRTAEKP